MTIRVAAVQMIPLLMDRAGNLKQIESKLVELADDGVKLAIFPEAAVTGYCFETLAEAMPFAEVVPGPSVEHLQSVCRRLDMHVIFGTLEKDGERLFNVALLVGPDGLIARYRKIHLPYLGIDRFATKGDRPFAVHEVAGLGGLRIGMLICYDGSFPEAPRCLALAGADLIALPTNWPPGAECQVEHNGNVRAHENQVYYIACNRVGEERGFKFIGGSHICAPGGATIVAANHREPAVIVADIDPALARAKRIVRVPEKHIIDRFADRRPELYGRLVEPTSK